MSRPHFITNEEIARWDIIIDNDLKSFKQLANSSILREVMYAGRWLIEQLEAAHCSQEIIARIQYTAGKMSFGRDPWEVHQHILELYHSNELEFEPEPININ